MTSRIRLIVVAAAALLLAGCSAPSLPGGSDGGGQSSDDGGGSSTENNPLGQIPATWPAEIPLPDGEVVAGLDLGTGWSVTIKTDDPQAAWVTTTDALKSQGYEVLQESSADDGSFGVYENDVQQVQVTSLLNDPQEGKVFHIIIAKKG